MQPLLSKYPPVTEYEAKVFRRFVGLVKQGTPHWKIQLEGNKNLPVVAAGFRLMKKGLLRRSRATCWHLTDLGEELARELIASSK